MQIIIIRFFIYIQFSDKLLLNVREKKIRINKKKMIANSITQRIQKNFIAWINRSCIYEWNSNAWNSQSNANATAAATNNPFKSNRILVLKPTYQNWIDYHKWKWIFFSNKEKINRFEYKSNTWEKEKKENPTTKCVFDCWKG